MRAWVVEHVERARASAKGIHQFFMEATISNRYAHIYVNIYVVFKIWRPPSARGVCSSTWVQQCMERCASSTRRSTLAIYGLGRRTHGIGRWVLSMNAPDAIELLD
ncbi:hypothetical protein Dimus_030738, partial [Dionaea muscipula]